jgi:predicted Rossmann fold nucleotide-binding protein DprA/Smf involved in DNA uptake
MSEEKIKTINIIKQKRQVSDTTKQKRKVFADIRKQLMNALGDGAKTIPELASLTGLPQHDVTYYLMSLRKFGDVTTGEVDDDDAYFYYELKKKDE